MKTLNHKILVMLLATLLIAFTNNATATMGFPFSKKVKGIQEVGDHLQVTGKIVDEESKTPLAFATIAITGSNFATVSNIDGEFTIKIPKATQNPQLEISYLGYKNLTISLDEFEKRKNVLKMIQAKIQLDQVTIRPLEANEIITSVLANIKNNYSSQANIMTGFYRETVKKGKNYVGISEAVMEIYKTPYVGMRNDYVKIYKGRKSTDVKKMDTLLFKLQSGPQTALLLDVAKNPYFLFTEDYAYNYDFAVKSITSIDNQNNYVIEFNQKSHIKDPLYKGNLYIDIERLAITGVEFTLNLENLQAATNLFVRKKPFGVKVSPTKATYLVKYKLQNDKWFFNYVRGEVKFKVKWKKRLFNSEFSTMTEMAITDHSIGNPKDFDFKNRMRPREVLHDKVSYFTDDNFWGDYNYIEPDQSIESAIKKLNRKLKKRSK